MYWGGLFGHQGKLHVGRGVCPGFTLVLCRDDSCSMKTRRKTQRWAKDLQEGPRRRSRGNPRKRPTQPGSGPFPGQEYPQTAQKSNPDGPRWSFWTIRGPSKPCGELLGPVVRNVRSGRGRRQTQGKLTQKWCKGTSRVLLGGVCWPP